MFTEDVQARLGRGHQIEHSPDSGQGEARRREAQHSQLTRAKELLGWQTATDFRDGIAKTVQHALRGAAVGNEPA